ncbi:hypothetical protein T484DRAFT_1835282, partial [Baffinella frigidus]
ASIILHAIPLFASPFAILVPVPSGKNAWKAVLFGFTAVFLVTQVFSLPQWAAISPRLRVLAPIAAGVLLLVLYIPDGFENLQDEGVEIGDWGLGIGDRGSGIGDWDCGLGICDWGLAAAGVLLLVMLVNARVTGHADAEANCPR